ncbi:MAG: type II toxin-antitoxin system HicA family toxin [Chloroflexi bacterium]|nr:type II toxin-antitoxin system HicA family toxin [Chloroflexota bacterium]
MPPFGPISRQDLIAALKRSGFQGPYPRGSHEFLMHGSVHLMLPNPHGSVIGRGLLGRILRQAGMTREEWERL